MPFYSAFAYGRRVTLFFVSNYSICFYGIGC